MRFTKMHGLGNDYIYVNCFEEKVRRPAELARLVSDRNFGIGADGLILIGPSQKADVKMRIFNADGSEAEMCGNGIRCVAKYTYEHGLAKKGGEFSVCGKKKMEASLKIETLRGVLTVGLSINKKNKVEKVCVNMGEPILERARIPVRLSGKKIIEHPIEVLGEKLVMSCVSMGNPHAVFFCKDVEKVALERLGPAIECHELFPKRTNVHFVEVVSRKEFKMRTWERGSGITKACGTGACACCVAGVLCGYIERVCTGQLLGGRLELNWCTEDNCVYMTGPTTEVFEGVWGK